MHLLDASMLWGTAGGIRRVIDAKHHWLPSFGWRHTVMAPSAQADGAHDVPSLPLPGTGGYRLVWRRHLAARLMAQWQPDIIEAADPYTMGWAALDAACALRIPAVAYCHSHLPSLAATLAHGVLSASAERLARAYLQRLYAHFDLVLAPSRWVADDLRSRGLAQARYQPLGVDRAHFCPARRDMGWRARWLVSHGHDPRTRVLLYAGRFAPEKRLGLLVDAVNLLGPGHLLVAVGCGPQPPRGAQVLVAPVVRRPAVLARLIASSDVFVHAGERETFGLAVLEAMACGTPLVTSPRGGCGELASGVGLTVGSRDAAVWAQAIDEQLHRPTEESRRAGLRIARQHDWSQVLGPWLSRYRTLIAQRQEAGRDTGHPGARARAAATHP